MIMEGRSSAQTDTAYHGFYSDKLCLNCSLPLGAESLPYCNSVCEAVFEERAGLKRNVGEHMTGVERFVAKHGSDWRGSAACA
jgi:hypothetical protein